IIDLHILRSHHFNVASSVKLFTDPAEEKRFAGFWEELSDHLKGHPEDRVAYELMNEPVAKDPEDWNRVARTAYNTLRAREKTRIIVLGSNRWNAVDQLPALWIPEDRNTIITFHYYLPMLVTHCRANWTDVGKYTGPVNYPGKPVSDVDF